MEVTTTPRLAIPKVPVIQWEEERHYFAKPSRKVWSKEMTKCR
jgi:hypothetical protein